MAHTLPFAAHGDTQLVVAVKDKMEGSKENRHKVGTDYTAPMPFDGCAPATITILGVDPQVTQAELTERNMKFDFVKARFKDLVISYRGGDYGAIVYSGTATGVEFLNLTAPAGVPRPLKKHQYFAAISFENTKPDFLFI